MNYIFVWEATPLIIIQKIQKVAILHTLSLSFAIDLWHFLSTKFDAFWHVNFILVKEVTSI